jgi:diguanylate cyclase (GGDEF)-like protein/PAS domain S-box-containing protein
MRMSAFDDSEICRSILENLPTGLCVVDLQKKIMFWSSGAEQITGHLRHEVIGHSCVSEPLLHCDQPGCEFCSEECPVARAIKTSRAAAATGFLHHKQGHEIPVRIRAVPVRNQHGSIIGAVEVFEDLQQAASPDRGEPRRQLPDCVDSMTGVASRAMMQSHLRQGLLTFAEARIPFGLLLLRIEGLQHFRSALGPEAAASLLRVVARTLESALWITDFVGRWSDDQFLAIVSGGREETLCAMRERIRRTLAGEGIEWWGERRSLPVSIGEASTQADDTVESMLERVQKSMADASAWHRRASAASGSSSSGS